MLMAHSGRLGLPRQVRAAFIAVVASAFTGMSPALAQVTVSVGLDSRSGSIRHDGIDGLPFALVEYEVNPATPYIPFEFDECVGGVSNQGLTAFACIDSISEWTEMDFESELTSGFTVSSQLKAQLQSQASEDITISIIVAGLSQGESVPFSYVGSATNGDAFSFGTFTATLTGPATAETHSGPGAWNKTLHLGNGVYTLTTAAWAAGGPHQAVWYDVTLERLPVTCGSIGAGSCFSASGQPYCNDSACCTAICAFDPFCCNVAWDFLCVSSAISECLTDLPLCAGTALQFGLNDRAEVFNYGNFAPLDAITIEFWQRIDGPSQNSVISCQSDLTNRIVTHTPWLSGNVIFDFGSAFGGGRIEVPAPADIFDGWHHFAFVASNIDQEMRIYYDGVLIKTKAGANAFQHDNVPLLIADNFDGAIDELRIWNVARTSEQIAADYVRTVPGNSPGLTIQYRMDSSTTELVDSALLGGSTTATVVGTATAVADGPCPSDLCDDYSLFFAGRPAHVDVGPMADFGSQVGESTLEFWFRSDNTQELMAPIKIIDDRPGDGDPVYAVEFNRSLGGSGGCTPSGVSPGRTLFFIRDNNLKVLAGEIDAPILDGQWHHISWRVIDAATNQMEVYIDGVLEPFVALCEQSPNAFTPWSDFLTLGAANNRGTIESHYTGNLDEVRIFSVARTPAEIMDNWTREIAPTTPGLVGYWRFEEGAGTTLYDYAAGQHGTAVGPVFWDSATPCANILGDLNGDQVVDGADLGLLLSNWGGDAVGDLNADGIVDGADLGLLLSNWG